MTCRSPEPRMYPSIEEETTGLFEDRATMHLVPCRWSKNGFKYVQVDLKDHNKFFKNPNRVNGHGKREKSTNAAPTLNIRHMYSSTGTYNERRASETTYGTSVFRDKT